eukprot:TRINITY_DN33522_c0_g1_i1.p1 TRINITY_DN33522_c0_g1~~TRINITY_DN33522_c0_g1_i1.p1  ORF type:complete len:190 (+),score=36.20 TRINITY_DN33522_c0_g1_i1:55-624(+)
MNYKATPYTAGSTHPGWAAPVVSPTRTRGADGRFSVERQRDQVSDLMPGTSVYLIRQQCVPVDTVEDAPIGRLQPLPSGLKPAEGVVGAFATKEYAQFYMDRAAQGVGQSHEDMLRLQPEGASNAAPEGISADAWTKLRSAAANSSPASRVPDKDSEVGYKWVYRKWNIVVSVWIQRMTVDTPPAVALW